MPTNNIHQADLAHILWIGGGTDAGISSIAERLVAQYSLQLYSFDDHADDLWENHFSKIPSSYGYNLMAKSMDERWVLPSPQTMADHAIQIALECFPVIIEQLLAMPKEPLILAEGF